jgi:secondary thiamine-phosphate synthase enzyme
MSVKTFDFNLSTKGFGDLIDVTDRVQDFVHKSSLSDGTVTVFVPGSTAGVTTVEYESGLVSDLRAAFDRLIPRDMTYAHDSRWGDGNGFSHVRASLLGASLTVPFSDGHLVLGTWQQIVVNDFDNRSRKRRIIVQIMGE